MGAPPPPRPSPARSSRTLILIAVAVAAVVACLPVTKLLSLGLFALQVLVGGLEAPVDGREARMLAHVVSHSPRGNLTAALAAAVDYQSTREFFMSVGLEKGAILTAALANATSVLELGCYVGFSVATMAAALPAARFTTVEVLPRNAAVARAFLEHAGIADRVDVRVGTLADVLPSLVAAGTRFDGVFIDHDKKAYAPDLAALLDAGVLATPGAVIVADNLRVPGAPDYVDMVRSDPRLETVMHASTLEWLAEVPGATDVVGVSKVVA